MAADAVIEKLDQLVGAVDRLDWRFVRDTGDWAAYFHPDWEADPERIVLADGEEPSRNEIACITMLRHSLPALPALIKVARAALFVQGAANAPTDPRGVMVNLPRALGELTAALDELAAVEAGGEQGAPEC